MQSQPVARHPVALNNLPWAEPGAERESKLGRTALERSEPPAGDGSAPPSPGLEGGPGDGEGGESRAASRRTQPGVRLPMNRTLRAFQEELRNARLA